MARRLRIALIAALLAAPLQAAFGWGGEGHSIVAEIAQRRLDPTARAAVADLLGGSLASVASWADDVRDARPETYRWHFVDIPLSRSSYDAAKDCALDPRQGDCVVAELARLKTQLRCAPTAQERTDALRFAVHFVGDIHQPLHTVDDLTGGNRLTVSGTIHGAACGKNGCSVGDYGNLHALWDTGLIRMSFYDWGAYVDRLEGGALRSATVLALAAQRDPVDWAQQTHAVAQQVWNDRLVPANGVLGDDYYKAVQPLLDQQLAVAGLRLAGFLDDAYATACETAIAPRANLGDLKAALAHYYGDVVGNGRTQYQLDQERVTAQAQAYVAARLAAAPPPPKPAIVLDIDETSLDNHEQLALNDYGYIAHGPCELKTGYACGSEAWDGTERAAPVLATLALYLQAQQQHVAVFFVTGRRDTPEERAHTAANLEHAGYHGWDGLVLRPTGAQAAGSVADYKAAARAGIEARGYTILVNLGDQASDLAGGHAERAFRMPNPFYVIP